MDVIRLVEPLAYPHTAFTWEVGVNQCTASRHHPYSYSNWHLRHVLWPAFGGQHLDGLCSVVRWRAVRRRHVRFVSDRIQSFIRKRQEHERIRHDDGIATCGGDSKQHHKISVTRAVMAGISNHYNERVCVLVCIGVLCNSVSRRIHVRPLCVSENMVGKRATSLPSAQHRQCSLCAINYGLSDTQPPAVHCQSFHTGGVSIGWKSNAFATSEYTNRV